MEVTYQMNALKNKCYSVEKIAEMFGIGVDTIYDYLSILKMDPRIQLEVEAEKLSLYQALIINRFPDSKRFEILKKTLKEGRSVDWLRRELKQIISHPFYKGSIEYFSTKE